MKLSCSVAPKKDSWEEQQRETRTQWEIGNSCHWSELECKPEVFSEKYLHDLMTDMYMCVQIGMFREGKCYATVRWHRSKPMQKPLFAAFRGVFATEVLFWLCITVGGSVGDV